MGGIWMSAQSRHKHSLITTFSPHQPQGTFVHSGSEKVSFLTAQTLVLSWTEEGGCCLLYVNRLVTLGNIIKLSLFQLQGKVIQIGLHTNTHTHTHTHTHLLSTFPYRLWSAEGQFTAETMPSMCSHTHSLTHTPKHTHMALRYENCSVWLSCRRHL